MSIHNLFSSFQYTFIRVAGETDFLKQYGAELIEHFVDPVVIHHPKGHTIPRLGNFLNYYKLFHQKFLPPCIVHYQFIDMELSLF